MQIAKNIFRRENKTHNFNFVDTHIILHSSCPFFNTYTIIHHTMMFKVNKNDNKEEDMAIK